MTPKLCGAGTGRDREGPPRGSPRAGKDPRLHRTHHHWPCTLPQVTQKEWKAPPEGKVLRNNFWRRPFPLESLPPPSEAVRASKQVFFKSCARRGRHGRTDLPQLVFCWNFYRKGTVFSFCFLTAKSRLSWLPPENLSKSH